MKRGSSGSHAWLDAGRTLLSRMPAPVRRPAKSPVLWWRHRGLKPSDVFIASYPKSGNTWLRHLLAHAVDGHVDGWHGNVDRISIRVGRHCELRSVLPGQGRLIKTHERFRTEYRRVVLMVRHPADVAVSLFHYRRQYGSAKERERTMPSFIEAFVRGDAAPAGRWDRYHAGYLLARDRRKTDLMIVRYEDFKTEPVTSFAGVLAFIGLDLDRQRIESAIDDCDVNSMRARERMHRQQTGEAHKRFVRHAKAGGGREELSAKDFRRIEMAFGDEMAALGYDADGSANRDSAAEPAHEDRI